MDNTHVSVTTKFKLPDAIASFAGQINDTDGHEAMPIKRWADVYGNEVKPLADALLNAGNEGQAIILNPELDADVTEINTHNVWKVKMEKAPGSFDIKRRIEVMDFMGVHRQIMYPGIAPIYAHALYNKADDPKVFRSITGDRKAYAYRLMDIYNDWCGRVSREQDRVRPTALLIDETPEAMAKKAKRLIDSGVRLFMLATDEPPGGVSPASPRMDPVWSLLASANCAALGHISISEKLLATLEWRNAPAFQGWMLGAEFSLDPWTLSNSHLQVQNYLMTIPPNLPATGSARSPRIWIVSMEAHRLIPRRRKRSSRSSRRTTFGATCVSPASILSRSVPISPDMVLKRCFATPAISRIMRGERIR